MHRPKNPFNVPFMILNPTYEKVQGKNIAKYPETGEKIQASFLSFGGTESTVNGVLSIIDTASVETWYRPDIKADSRLKKLDDGKVYGIKGEPENINCRNQFLKFKVERVRGSNG